MREAEQQFARGVSSDIQVVETPGGPIVVKAALAKLRVAADWRSDTSRSNVEVAALRAASELLGADAVPRILWEDAAAHRFAMELIAADLAPLKTQLLAGHAALDSIARAGELLAALHARSAREPELAQRFAETKFFEELRIVPYFLRLREAHPAIAPGIEAMVERIRATRTALVHGDYSPKNLLAKQRHVVILDWEVAHWGDPRFDLAFFAAHLILKRLVVGPVHAAALATFLDAYAPEGPNVFDRSLVELIGAMLLARVDGDSPVEYLDDAAQARTRALGRRLFEDRAIAVPRELPALVETALA